jgi:putative FmdB family regulatory protein
MPEYTFLCAKCKATFSIVCSIRDYSDKQKCQYCKSQLTHRHYATDLSNITGSVVKTDSELKTLGDLANRNRDRMSEDQKQALHQKHNSYRETQQNTPMPNGMTRIPKTNGVKWT